MFNEAFEREKYDPAHVPTLPLYFDYLDADEENAIASQDGKHYAFVGVTRRLVFQLSDVCLLLSRPDGAICRALRLRPSAEPYNEMQGMLLYILLSFVAAHEWAHHKMGHLGQLSSRQHIFHEVLDSGLVGSVDDQVKELSADAYSTLTVLTHIFDERRSSFLPFLKFDPCPPPEVLDQVFLASFIVAVGGYLFLRPPADLSGLDVYHLTHPPSITRLNFVMRQAASWCSCYRPTLEDWIVRAFGPLMNAVVEDIHGVSDYRAVWAAQLSFRKSEAGRQYDAILTAEENAYRKAWGMNNEEAEIIEPPQELQLELVRGADDLDFQRAKADFSEGLSRAGIAFSTRSRTFDSATGTVMTGALLVITTLGPTAIIEFRKLLQSYLAHGGRKIKLKNGPLHIEASADDFLKIFTPEQIQQLIEPPTSKTLPATKPPKRDKVLPG